MLDKRMKEELAGGQQAGLIPAQYGAFAVPAKTTGEKGSAVTQHRYALGPVVPRGSLSCVNPQLHYIVNKDS
jgi:hypothetical protein